MTWYRYLGRILKVDGKIAVSDNCCCNAGGCCCPQFGGASLPDMLFELSGVIAGSETFSGVQEQCGVWTGSIPLDDDYCDGEFTAIAGVTATLECPADGTAPEDVTASLVGGSAVCDISALTLVSASCSPKFTARFSFSITEIIPTCSCDTETGFLDITEV